MARGGRTGARTAENRLVRDSTQSRYLSENIPDTLLGKCDAAPTPPYGALLLSARHK